MATPGARHYRGSGRRNFYSPNMYGRNTRSQTTGQVKRYNTPGTFVAPQVPQPYPNQQLSPQVWSQPHSPPQLNMTSIPLLSEPEENMNLTSGSDENGKREGKWLKKGFKLSMKEKRRRQNKTLRKLIAPKNALMVLNELAAGSQQECTVVPDGEGFGCDTVNRQYVAILNMGGKEYSGKGSTKLMAKNQAAECVIRDMILKQMQDLPTADGTNGTEVEEKEDTSFPMIQLASYALHKLFTEWTTEGYKVPLFGNNTQPKTDSPTGTPAGSITGGPTKPKKAPQLPPNPQSLHPCSLLSQMFGMLEYTMTNADCNPVKMGQVFSMNVTVNGKTYTGTANSKKEARKEAAKNACIDLYEVNYSDEDEKMDTAVVPKVE